MPHLVATFKLRLTRHKARLLHEAQARWHHGYVAALSAALKDRPLVRLLESYTDRKGERKWRVNQRERTLLARRATRTAPLALHSSARSSLQVVIEQTIGSWAGQHCTWLNAGKPADKRPAPPAVPLTTRQRVDSYSRALDLAPQIGSLRAENYWRTVLTRRQEGRLMPVYFGAMTCGSMGPHGRAYHHHAGLLKRSGDARFFIALTLWPKDDGNRAPARRALNRLDRGQLFNVRSAEAWDPARCESVVVMPVEMGHGVRNMFIRHGVPKSAQLVERDGDYEAHVAFELPDAQPRELTGCVLACERGIDTLVRWVLVNPEGEVLLTGAVEGRGLKTLVRHIIRVRAIRQRKAHLNRGDRRISRPVEHHLRSTARQLRSLAAEYGAEIVVLKPETPMSPGRSKPRKGRPTASRPGPMLKHRHWAELYEHLVQYAREAGLPPPSQAPLYGRKWICVVCGEQLPRRRSRNPACPRCGTLPDVTQHTITLLALQTLRYRKLGYDRCKGHPLSGWLHEQWIERRDRLTAATGSDIEVQVTPELAEWLREALAEGETNFP